MLALLVGYSSVFLSHLDGALVDGSVTVLEDPDLLRARGGADNWRCHPCVAEVIAVGYSEPGTYLAAAAAAHRRASFAAVVPCLEYAVLAAATIADSLGLPGAGRGAAAALRDKLVLRSVTTRAGMAAPVWGEVRRPADVAAVAASGPVVVKPADLQASVGVHLLTDAAEAESVWKAMLGAADSLASDRRPAGRYLAERRLYGPEYSVEALVRDGVVRFENITEKQVASGRYPVELGHLVPAPVDSALSNELSHALRTLIGCIGFGTGVLHAEFIVTDVGPVLIECAGRVPGDRIMDLIDLAYGGSMYPALVRLLAGEEVSLPREPLRAAAIRFLHPGAGTVIAVEGVEAARRREGVHDISVTVDSGTRVHQLRSSWDRVGHVIVSSAAPLDARILAADIAADISVAVR